jgi:hypothetical protein
MFLPDYLMKGFDSSQLRSATLVRSKTLILPSVKENESSFAVTPMMVMVALLVLGGVVTFVKKPAFIKIGRVLDVALYFLLGIAGCLMLYMWYGTDHELCRNNYNLYWALPTHIVAAFMVGSKAAIVRKYFTVTTILNAVFLLLWLFLPQGMNAAFFPLILLSAIRSFHHTTNK